MSQPGRDPNKRGRWTGFDVGGGQGTPRRPMTWVWALLLGVAVLLILSSFLGRSRAVEYSEFLRMLQRGRVTEAVVTDASVRFTLENGDTLPAALPPVDDGGDLIRRLNEAGVPYTGEQPSWFTSLLAGILPLLLVMGLLWFILFRRMQGGAAAALNLGRNKVRIYDRKEMKTNFADVAGLDEAVAELREIVDFLKNPKKYQRLGGRIPKGVLLLGPPGSGKTLLARAVAGEADVPFFYISGSEFIEMFVGVGASRVRELFEQAKTQAPCIIFIDELDTIGKSRSAAITIGGHDEREQTLNQLLAEMDGLDPRAGVIIMAATKPPEG